MSKLIWTFSQAAKSLRRSRGFTVAAIAILGTVVGANVATFSILNAALLRPLPYPNADELVAVRGNFPSMGLSGISVSPGEFLDYHDRNKVFESIAAYQGTQQILTDPSGSTTPVAAVAATDEIFDVLGVPVAAGRAFRAEDLAAGAAPVAVLGAEFWRRHFGSDNSIVGRSINVSGTSFEVVGIAREDLKFPPGLAAAPPDLWLPLAFGQNARAVRGNRSFQVIARLRGGVPLARANEDLTGVATAFVAENANNYPAGAAFAPSVHSIVNDMRANVKPTLLLFMGAVLFVLLVGCANLANLLLVRGSARQSELAVRIALGASARTVVAQLLSESFLISVGGALFGVALSLVTLKVLIAIGGTTVPWLAEATIDWHVLSFAAATTVVTTIAFGLFPARSAVSLSFHQSIRAGGKGSTGNAAQRRTRSLLLAGEIAVATVLLSGSALLLKSFQRVLSDSPGFRPEGVITARVTAPGARFADTTAVRGFYTELVRVVGEIPGVEQASLASILPLSGNRTDWSFAIEGRVIGAGSPPPDEQIRQIAPGYFATIGSSMVEGRDFLPTDRVGAGLVVIVNHALAAKWWPGESAIGKRVSFSGQNATPEWRTIVGIVADMRHNALDAPMEPQLYLPFAQTPFLTRGMSVVARVHDPSPAVSAALQRAIATVDPGQPTRQVSTIMSLVTASVAPRRFAMLLISGFATLSLVIAALGTFAVTAFAVTQRTREMGIRMALGASPGDAVRSIVREGAVIAVLGIVAGVAAAIPAMGVIRNQLYGVSAVDPSSLVTVAAALATIAVGASYLPARRIARVSPTIALRDE